MKYEKRLQLLPQYDKWRGREKTASFVTQFEFHQISGADFYTNLASNIP